MVVVHPAGEALVEVAGRGVERAVEGLAVAAEEVARLGGDPLVDVDRLEAAARVQGQADLCRGRRPSHANRHFYHRRARGAKPGGHVAFRSWIPYHRKRARAQPQSRGPRVKEARNMLPRSVVLTAALAALAPAAGAQTVDEVIARSVEARGGLARIRAIQSVRMTGRMSMGEMDMPMSVELKRPSRFRAEMTPAGPPGRAGLRRAAGLDDRADWHRRAAGAAAGGGAPDGAAGRHRGAARRLQGQGQPGRSSPAGEARRLRRVAGAS